MAPERRDFKNSSDAELVARALKGEAEAFGQVYDRYLDPLYRYAYYRVGDHAEAEDLTETVFLKAWEALPRLELRSVNLRAWLYRIAHNTVIDHLRARKPTLPLEAAAPIQDRSPAPEATQVRREQVGALAQAMAGLKPELQQVLACRFFSGMSHAETAAVMALKEGHVRVLQHRALKQVRVFLEMGDF
jgi:RNA polymerase sigma-70 factor (ECF subfamily)